MRFHAGNSQCKLYVRRTGIFAAVGHDLELGVRDYHVDVDASIPSVRAEFDARSVHVVEAVDSACAPRPGALTAKDKAQIDANIVGEVLQVARYPLITFESSAIEVAAHRYFVRGRLTLTGRVREIALPVLREGDGLRLDVALHQPDFGIAPFRALGGGLRLAPDVRFCFSARAAAT
jgi:YceI-like domain